MTVPDRKEFRDPHSGSPFLAFLMLSAFAPHLSPAVLGQRILSHAAFISKVAINSQSRSLIGTPWVKEPHSEQLYKSRPDKRWNLVEEYAEKNVIPKRNPEEIWQERSNKLEPNPPLNNYAGRSVLVRTDNISGALKSLSRRLKANNVYQTWKYQMRHEKKGVKRRRLKSQRWRRRFADEIRKKIALVRSIQRRGQ